MKVVVLLQEQKRDPTKEDKEMWRYEVAFYNEDGVYQWKGFGDAVKFERYLRRLKKKGLRILKVSDWDSEGIGAKLKEEYIA